MFMRHACSISCTMHVRNKRVSQRRCKENDIPLVFALTRKKMGELYGHRKRVSAVAVLSHASCEDIVSRMVALAAAGRAQFEAQRGDGGSGGGGGGDISAALPYVGVGAQTASFGGGSGSGSTSHGSAGGPSTGALAST